MASGKWGLKYNVRPKPNRHLVRDLTLSVFRLAAQLDVLARSGLTCLAVRLAFYAKDDKGALGRRYAESGEAKCALMN